MQFVCETLFLISETLLLHFWTIYDKYSNQLPSGAVDNLLFVLNFLCSWIWCLSRNAPSTYVYVYLPGTTRGQKLYVIVMLVSEIISLIILTSTLQSNHSKRVSKSCFWFRIIPRRSLGVIEHGSPYRTPPYAAPVMPNLMTVGSHQRLGASNRRPLHCLFDRLFRFTTPHQSYEIRPFWTGIHRWLRDYHLRIIVMWKTFCVMTPPCQIQPQIRHIP